MSRRFLIIVGAFVGLALAPLVAQTAQKSEAAEKAPAKSAPQKSAPEKSAPEKAAPSAGAPPAAVASASATGRKGCEDLKDEISKKLDAKGVKNYTLDAVAAGDVKPDDRVIGSCDGGTKKITYKRE